MKKILICNPFIGKPAYVPATAPCGQVKPSCSNQEAVDPDEPPPVDDSLVTPDCVQLSFASNENEAVVPLVFSLDPSDDRYDTGVEDAPERIVYDQTFGWVVTTDNGTFYPSTVTNNPLNTYVATNGDIVSITPCTENA